MQILLGITRFVIVDDTADRILIIIQRNKGIAVPSSFENICTVKGVGVLNAVYGFFTKISEKIIDILFTYNSLKVLLYCYRSYMPVSYTHLTLPTTWPV